MEREPVRIFVIGGYCMQIAESELFFKEFRVILSEEPVSYTHLRSHETGRNRVFRLMLE